jgi:DNA-binding XRE family transcriptional regulator
MTHQHQGEEMKRVHKKISRSEAEKAELSECRNQFQSRRPSLNELIESDEFDGPIHHGETPDAMRVAHLLKRAREVANLSLAEVAERCGIDRSAISRLENGVYENTTINTLSRLASAYGKQFVVDLVDVE